MHLPLFLETLRLIDGQWSNLHFHNERLNRTRKSHFGAQTLWDLAELVVVPAIVQKGLYKCRVSYGEMIEKVEFEPYQQRLIQSLCIIHDNTIKYDFKYQDRSHLNHLFAQRGEADDVLIAKNGLITDTSYANIVFWNGEHWLTPDSYLLAGTQRARLLEEKVIFEQKIRAQDLPKYSHARIINSMLDFEMTYNILIANIQ